MTKFRITKNRKEINMIVGNHLEKYKTIYLVLMSLVTIFELALLIRGFIVYKSYSVRHRMYLISYSFLLVVSLATAIFLGISLKKKYSYMTYNILLRGYSICIIIWSMLISYLDMDIGNIPIVYLTVIITIAGIVVLEPSFYFPLIVISATILIICDGVGGFTYFISAGEFINFFVFLSMATLISARHYIVSVKEYKSAETLEASVLEERKRVSTISLQTIMSISNAVDAKDKYTREHSQRVAEYSKIIAENLNWEESKVNELHEIALLHDIGKIGVPDSILNSTNRLTDEEFSLMKQHTVIGGEILKDLTILKNVDLGAKYHHERYDGTGYPSKLKGEEIPIEARIIAVADAFDAMNSNRVYRQRLTNEKILSELVNGKGKQFDPYLVDVFLPFAKKLLEANE